MILLPTDMRQRYTRAAGLALADRSEQLLVCSWCGAELDFVPFACPACDMANTVMQCTREDAEFWGVPQREAYEARMGDAWDGMTADVIPGRPGLDPTEADAVAAEAATVANLEAMLAAGVPKAKLLPVVHMRMPNWREVMRRYIALGFDYVCLGVKVNALPVAWMPARGTREWFDAVAWLQNFAGCSPEGGPFNPYRAASDYADGFALEHFDGAGWQVPAIAPSWRC